MQTTPITWLRRTVYSLFGNTDNSAATTSLFKKNINRYLEIAQSIPNWHNDMALELARLSFSLPDNAVVAEIGSFLGSGTILLAGARKIRGSGTTHAVDPFDCSGDSASVSIYQKILTETGSSSLRECFDRNIRNADLNAWVEVHQGCSADVATNWGTPLDMLFLDGDQSRHGAREAYDSWSRYLKPGGIIAVGNSAPDNYRQGHDGSRVIVEEEIHPPSYDDVYLVWNTTFARKV